MPWSPLPDGRASRPTRLAGELDRVLSGLGAPPKSALDVVAGVWAELVGPAAADALRPTAIRDGVLLVAASDPVWAGQARWLEAAVVEGLEPLLGPGVVTSLRARAAPRKG